MENEHYVIFNRVHGLYQKYGIKSITMDDVARELGMSKKTLYQIFNDKNDLVLKTLNHALDRFMELVYEIQDRQLNAIDELIAINQVVNQTIEKYHNPAIDFDLKKYHAEIFGKFSENKRSKIHKVVVYNMEKGKMQGLYRQNLNVEIIARLHISRIEDQDSMEYYCGDRFTTREVMREVFEYHLRGICSSEGIAHFENRINETINN